MSSIGRVRSVVAVVTVSSMWGCATQGVGEAGAGGLDVSAAVATITVEDYAAKIGVIAADSMRGRWTPSPELDRVAAWIAAELGAAGLVGGAEGGTFLQRYPLPTAPDSAPNVVALLRGSDPVLADEYVVFSAHMDHIGVGPPDLAGDSVFNGADDDASGTAAVMEVAEAMAALETRPRRSMLFVLVSGEEGGLWGSQWFAEHPPVPVEALVANLNVDMIGRNWPDTVVAIGKEHSDLGATLERVAAAHPELDMAPIDDLWPEQRFYYRSDHYNFARKGVPVLFFFSGVHDDYHGYDDEPDRIDAEKASRIAKLLFYLGLEVANADARPRWDPSSRARIVESGR